MNRQLLQLCLAAWACFAPPAWAAAADVVFADFESADYGEWKTTGTALGSGPATGTLPGQMAVGGFEGQRLVNTFLGGDDSLGTLTSPEFKIDHGYIAFIVGGGGFEAKTCVNLLVNGRVVRSATGPNKNPGGSENLEKAAWDVTDLQGQTARIEVVDAATGSWGHINLDQIVFTDRKPAVDQTNAAREMTAEKRYLHFPVKNGATKRQVTVSVDGQPQRQFEIELADGQPDWWAPLLVDPWRGKSLRVKVDRLSSDSGALAGLEQSDTLKAADDLYREPLRPQFHFSARRGWLNDPNGLVFHDGEYHLFLQHNPYGREWGNMHWGHAVSKDLVHWQELDEALYPDAMGPMFSGSAVVDRQNTSDFGTSSNPPLVLIYTAAGSPTVQCLAYSIDNGRSFTKYHGNPILGQVTGGNRDPKVLWHEPTRSWVMSLYIEREGKHTIQFFTSRNLKDWTPQGIVDSFFECPDLFALPVGSGSKNPKWVLTAASSEYMVGKFDGQKFVPETPKLPGQRGAGFYAAQTFSTLGPQDDRQIQIGWLQAPSPGMPFNQCMSVPQELSLRATSDGPRLAWQPVKELTALRATSHRIDRGPLKPGFNPLAKLNVDLVEVRLDFAPGDAEQVALNVRGNTIAYESGPAEIVVNGHRAPAPLQRGRQRLVVLLDRTTLEVFASDGLTYVPLPTISRPESKDLELTATGGTAEIIELEVHELKSAWPASP